MSLTTDKFSQTAPIANPRPAGGKVPSTTAPLPRPAPDKDRIISKVIVYGR
jgi:hypothetical protein